MDALSIATVVPKEAPNNFIDLMENRILNRINRKVISRDRKQREVNENSFSCIRKLRVFPSRVKVLNFINHRIKYSQSQSLRGNQDSKISNGKGSRMKSMNGANAIGNSLIKPGGEIDS